MEPVSETRARLAGHAPWAVARLAQAVGELAGSEVSLERPKDPAHGDYATNVALQTARDVKRPPREVAEELAAAGRSAAEGRQAEVAGPGFVNIRVERRLPRRAARRGRSGLRRRLGQAARARSRSSSSRPTRPGRSRSPRAATPRSATASPACSPLPATRSSASTTQRHRRADGPLPRLGRGAAARRAPARGRLPGRLRRAGSPPGRATRSPPCWRRSRRRWRASAIHFDSWARQSDAGTEPRRAARRAADLSARRRALRALDRLRRRRGPGAACARPSAAGTPTYEAADIAYLPTSSSRGYDRAIYVLGADHDGVRGWFAVVARMLG